jgi:hypothetical protein
MGFYEDKLEHLSGILGAHGYAIRVANAAVSDAMACMVTVGFPHDVLGQCSLIAVPDVHLSDGSQGDVFLNGTPGNAKRLAAVLRSIGEYMDAEREPVQLVQLGDWYDVWRSRGGDTHQASYASIDNVSVYQDVLALDKSLGMAHLIGNHDASFAFALPDRRVADGKRFRFGFGLVESNGRVFGLHGNQGDCLQDIASPEASQRAVWLGTLAAKYVWGEVRNLQDFFDLQGVSLGSFWNWVNSLVGENREGPKPKPRARLTTPDGFKGSFVQRENVAELVRISVEATARLYTHPDPLELLLVAHSHKPCVGVTPHPVTGSPVVVLDGGSFVQSSAQLVFGAANRISVFDILPSS